MNASILLIRLQAFLAQRAVDPESLTAESMVRAMADWFRLSGVDSPLEEPLSADVLLYRCGGWSEGCATGFKLSILRRVTEHDGKTDWQAGITLMFEPARFSDLSPLATMSSEWPSLDAFVRAVESSPAYRRCRDLTPMGVMLESGGLR